NRYSSNMSLIIYIAKEIVLYRQYIFVNAKKSDIEIVACILEIVGITSEESHLLLGCEDQPHVIVTFVSVKMICAALIQRDYVRSESGFIFAFLFNPGDSGVARVRSLVARRACLHRGRDARGYV